MPKLILKCPHIQAESRKSSSHLRNLVHYISTRDGAERAYKENYVDYISHRPRAQKLGDHALFDGSGRQPNLRRVMKEIAEHKGTVWLPILSLKREDAERVGCDCAEKWREILSANAFLFADAMRIPREQFHWYAAFHNEKHHPHVHMVCYSADGKSGFLTVKGMEKIKSALTRQIFAQELTEIYRKQTQFRDELTEESRRLIQEISSGEAENETVSRLLAELSEKLKMRKGKKQYGYLPKPLKALVDSIVDEMEKDERISAAFSFWYEQREKILLSYKDSLPNREPLSHRKEFRRIKNLIVAEAVRLSEMEQSRAELAGAVVRLFRNLGRIFEEQSRPLSPAPTEHKLRQKLRAKRLAIGHKADDREEKLQQQER